MIRVKHRYLLVEATSSVQNEALLNELLNRIGTRYYAVNPRILNVRGSMVIRCSLDGLSELIVALSLIKSIGGKECAFYTIRSSGTIRALMSK